MDTANSWTLCGLKRGQRRDIARRLRGHSLAFSRLHLGHCRILPGHGSDVAGDLPGVYRDNAGIFHRQLGEYFADIPPDVARKFRRLMSGHSVAIRRIFGGYGRLVETRGEASTLKFIQIV